MQKYIALLRGINVGGNNKVSMAILKEAFVKNGFSDVVTYINSGNVIFSSDCVDEMQLKARCEQIIAETFGLQIAVAIISAKDLAAALAQVPAWWDEDADAKHNAIFVIPPATAETIVEEIGATKPEYEKLAHYGNIIFWSAAIKTFSKTRWSKIVGTSAYGKITVRNANTTKKLLQLARDISR